jgi:hypothetical protein
MRARMPGSVRSLTIGLLFLALPAAPALAQGCRAQQIMTSQCTWFALQELGGNKQAADQAEREATSTLVKGCSQGEYQMVLLRGTPLADRVAARFRSRGGHDAAAVRAECAVEARRIGGR